jgi:general secretion pathway protein D
VIEDEPNNALVITATAQEYRRVRQVLERLDVAPNQVLLEATIAEVRLNDELKMGVRWFFQSGNNDLRFTDLASGAAISAFPGVSHFFNTKNIQVVFNALSSITDLNIISSPTLTVLDNKKATLQVGNEVPIVTQSAVAVVTPDAPVVNSVTYRNTGIVLSITPRVGETAGWCWRLSRASDVGRGPGTIPTIQQRRIKQPSPSMMKDRAGGLIQDR